MEDKNIMQHNVITEAKYEMTALEINLFISLIANLNPYDVEDKMYSTYIPDLELITGVRYKAEDIEHACDQLHKRVATIWDGEDFEKFNFVTYSKYSSANRTVQQTLNPKIRPWFINLKRNFTYYQLSFILNLKSKYSKRMYQIFCQYRSSGRLLMEVETLKERLEIITYERGKKKDPYPSIGKFCDRILKASIKEINSQTDLKIEYTTERTGRKVTHIYFEISTQSRQGTIPFKKVLPDKSKQEPVTEGDTILPYDINAPVEQKLAAHRLAPWQIKKIMENFSQVEISGVIYRIKIKVLNKEVKNVGAATAQEFSKIREIGIYTTSKS